MHSPGSTITVTTPSAVGSAAIVRAKVKELGDVETRGAGGIES